MAILFEKFDIYQISNHLQVTLGRIVWYLFYLYEITSWKIIATALMVYTMILQFNMIYGKQSQTGQINQEVRTIISQICAGEQGWQI